MHENNVLQQLEADYRHLHALPT